MDDASRFVAFVSLNRERPVPVARFGTGSRGRANQLIGAERDIKDPRVIHYFPERVVGLTQQEWSRYRREYSKALRHGELVRRSREDFLKAAEAETKLETERGEKLKAERDKAKKTKKPSKAKSSKPAQGTERDGDSAEGVANGNHESG